MALRGATAASMSRSGRLETPWAAAYASDDSLLARHSRKNSARTEDKPRVIDLDPIADRAALEALIKSFSESLARTHPSLRNPPEGLGVKLVEAMHHG